MIESLIQTCTPAAAAVTDLKICVALHQMLAPVTTLTRNFLQSLYQVTAWFQQNQSPHQHRALTLSSFAIAFLCLCENYPGLEEDILQSLPWVIRITIAHSLLDHRCDLESLQGLWIQFAQFQIQHCGFCSFHQSGWPLPSQLQLQPHSNRCSCNDVFPLSQKSSSASVEIPHRILILLGREDFVANQNGKLPTKDRYQLTDTCLLGTFPNLAREFHGLLPEEQDCNVSSIEFNQENPPSNHSTSSKFSLDDQDGLLNVEKSSHSRFSEDERINEVRSQS
jgi:hypothetical protein